MDCHIYEIISESVGDVLNVFIRSLYTNDTTTEK